MTGLKNVITAITGKDKKTAVLLGGSAADKELVRMNGFDLNIGC